MLFIKGVYSCWFYFSSHFNLISKSKFIEQNKKVKKILKIYHEKNLDLNNFLFKLRLKSRHIKHCSVYRQRIMFYKDVTLGFYDMKHFVVTLRSFKERPACYYFLKNELRTRKIPPDVQYACRQPFIPTQKCIKHNWRAR